MNETEEYFFQMAVGGARELSHQDCIKFLQGMLFFGGDHPASPALRRIVQSMTQNDQQLELIASGQLKFEELLRS